MRFSQRYSFRRAVFLLAIACALPASLHAQSPLSTPFRWQSSPPLVAPLSRHGETFHSVKDPTVVFHEGRWHLFCTVRGVKRSHQIEYISFTDWGHTADARREIVPLSSAYYCAPQVFYLAAERKWYMIHQMSDPTRKPELQPAYSTSEKLDDPLAWSPPQLLFDVAPKMEHWIDFWVIFDDAKAYLFCTSNNGKMWRSETTRERFPRGWTQPELALEADIFEASHTYRLRGQDQYLTIIEAEGAGRRYYKAYFADRLDGAWRPLADTQSNPFAGAANVTFQATPWAESISHGELLRTGIDERLEVDPDNLRLLYQGALDSEMAGKPYGEIPWRLGLLEPVR